MERVEWMYEVKGLFIAGDYLYLGGVARLIPVTWKISYQ